MEFEPYNLENLGWTRLPKPPISEDDKLKVGLNANCSNSQLLRQLCYKGFEEKLSKGIIPVKNHQEYTNRCKTEIETLENLNFIDYVLLVWKTIDKARELGVFIDYGRGSCVSSIVFWLLKITGCDPIKYNLFFSRFVSKARAKSKIVDGGLWLQTDLIPDADLNLGDGRDEIVKWLKEIYPNRITKITNVSTLTGKALIKDVYKVVEEVSEEEAKRVADLVERKFGVVQDIEDVYKEIPEFRAWADEHKETYEICLKLRDLNRQYSTHASGYLVSYDEITDHSPIFLDSEKQIACAYTMGDVQCIKLDLLGLNTNRIVKTVLELTGENVDNINLDDDLIIYNQFQNGNFHRYGLYQISSDCAYRITNEVKPKNILELSDVNALARPGALAWVKDYINNNKKSPHPLFNEALKSTRNLPLYQETLMQLLIAVGFTADDAEVCRKIVGKKQLDKVGAWKEKIYEKVKEKGLDTNIGDFIWKILNDSASYSFNKSHSLATSYLTALTVYLKYKYPLQFYLACLKDVKGKPDFIENISQINQELRHFNIELLPPHILHSDIDFKIEGQNIRFGLGGIKGISDKTIEKLNRFRTPHSNKFEVFMGAKEAGLSVAVLTNLILAGALDINGQKRSKVVYEAQLFNLLSMKEKQLCIQFGGQFSYDLVKCWQFNYDLVKCLKYILILKDEKGKPLIKETRYKTIKKHEEPYKKMYEFNSKNEKLCTYCSEKMLLGYSYSINLIDIYRPVAQDLITIEDVNGCLERERVHFVGEVLEVISRKGRESGRKYLKVLVQDHTGSVWVLLCNTDKADKILEHEEDNQKRVQENDIVSVRGSKGGDIVFAEKIGVQEKPIMFKKTDLDK